jgi:glycosyltransferase involved in cell wall biosynthesis
MSTQQMLAADQYGYHSYESVVEKVKPDVVLVIGDEWMIRHYQERPRDYKLVAYVPIDGQPMMHSWAQTFRGFDELVLYGDFGEQVVRAIDKSVKISKIPHGVDLETFKRLPAEARVKCREMIAPDADSKFIVGCVARNNVRKQIPRLLKAFKQFIDSWTACQSCGHVSHGMVPKCSACGATKDSLRHGKGAKNAMLYMHMSPEDPAGHKLIPLIHRFELNGYVGLPENMMVGKGVSDEQLNMFYNAFDVFTLPTGGEGWGLPILEAMAAGVPVLVTDYSAHVDFVKGAGEFVNVSDWDTCNANNMERALVDINDYVMKLDRMYYEREDFLKKWGRYMVMQGFPQDRTETLDCGERFRRGLGVLGAERAKQYAWGPIVEAWDRLLGGLVPAARWNVKQAPVTLEVI